MEEKNLLAISIICVIFGISVLFFIYENQDLEEINSIETHFEEDVKVKGTIKRITKSADLTFLEIERTTRVKVIFFEELDLEENDQVTIIGEVDKYKGEYEIIGKKFENDKYLSNEVR